METTGIRQVNAIVNILKRKGYKINQRDNELNIVGVRADSTEANKFDDRLYVFWKEGENWRGYDWAQTTDPGTYYLNNPLTSFGTAILKQGQYEYMKGQHKGYRALVQRGEVVVIRDYDRNAILDFNNGREQKGFFGINLHRAAASGLVPEVGMWSAGCQVTQSPDDFKKFMDWVNLHVEKYGNNTIYYTLIDQRALNREMKRKTLYLIGGAAAAIAYYYNK